MTLQRRHNETLQQRLNVVTMMLQRRHNDVKTTLQQRHNETSQQRLNSVTTTSHNDVNKGKQPIHLHQ